MASMAAVAPASLCECAARVLLHCCAIMLRLLRAAATRLCRRTAVKVSGQHFPAWAVKVFRQATQLHHSRPKLLLMDLGATALRHVVPRNVVNHAACPFVSCFMLDLCDGRCVTMRPSAFLAGFQTLGMPES